MKKNNIEALVLIGLVVFMVAFPLLGNRLEFVVNSHEYLLDLVPVFCIMGVLLLLLVVLTRYVLIGGILSGIFFALASVSIGLALNNNLIVSKVTSVGIIMAFIMGLMTVIAIKLGFRYSKR